MANQIDWTKVLGVTDPAAFARLNLNAGFDPSANPAMRWDAAQDGAGGGGGWDRAATLDDGRWLEALKNGNYNSFDATGNSTGTNWNDHGADGLAIKGLLAMAAMGAANGAFAGMGGGGAPAVGNGAFLGEGVASGIPAWDAAAGMGGASAGSAASIADIMNGLPEIQGLPNYALPEIGSLPGLLPTGLTLADIGTTAVGSGLLSGAGSAAAGSATKAALYGTDGYGPGMTGSETEVFDKSLNGDSPLDWLKKVGGGGSNLGALLGAVGGAASSGSQQSSQTGSADTTRNLDPRLDSMIFGPGSITESAMSMYKANPTGITPLMQQGLDMKIGALTDPAYGQTYTNMRNMGNGLLGQGMAGNPFTSGQATLNQPQNIQDLIKKGRGLLGG